MIQNGNSDFHETFKSKTNEISKHIEDGDQTSELLLKSIDEVQKLVQQRMGKLTKYDQERYGATLQTLREKVWKQKKPKQFKFKTKFGKPKAPVTEPRHIEAVEEAPPQMEKRNIFEESSQANVSVNNIQNSIIVYKEVTGAAYIDNVCDSKLYFRAQQCRVHNSRNLEIVLEKCLNPILENCQDIRFVVKECDEFKVFDFSARDDRNYQTDIVPTTSWIPISSFTEAGLNNK